MKRSYPFVSHVLPPSNPFHQSHATFPGRTHEKSASLSCAGASAHTMSASQNFAGASARMNTRHGNVRVPSVSTSQVSCSSTLIPAPRFWTRFGAPANFASNAAPVREPKYQIG